MQKSRKIRWKTLEIENKKVRPFILQKIHRKISWHKHIVDVYLPYPEKKEGEQTMTNTAKIRNLIREKGDIDEMIFAAQGKEAGQTQTHSDRWRGG